MVFNNNLLLGAAGQGEGYTIDQSIRFNDNDSAYLYRAMGTGGDTKTGTLSLWVKRANLGTTQKLFDQVVSTRPSYISFKSDDTIEFYLQETAGAGYALYKVSSNLYRDVGSWYHIYATWDTTQSSPEWNLYVNGVQPTWATDNNNGMSQNANIAFFGNSNMALGRTSTAATSYADAYLAEINCIEGSVVAISEFAETNADTGQWVPKKYTGSYPGKSFYITGADSADLGADDSGNGNDFTSSGLTAADQVTDSPTDNQATLNPLFSGVTLSDGNLVATASGNSYQRAFSTFAIDDGGKHVCEFQKSSGTFGLIGIMQNGNHTNKTGNSNMFGINLGNGEVFKANPTASVLTTLTAPANSLMRIEYDSSADTITIFDDGTEIFPAATGVSDTVGLTGHDSLHFGCAPYGSGTVITATFSPLSGTPTTGFEELTTANLPDPTIALPEKYFNTVLYEGNGGGQRVGGFQPITETYSVPNSVIFNDNDSAYLSRTPGSAGNRKTWTFSSWVKRASLFNGSVPQIVFSAANGSTLDFIMQFGQSDDTLRISDYSSGTASNLITTQLFRDTSSWYHFVLQYDTTQATSSDRMKLYVNGAQVTIFGTESYPSLNYDSAVNNNLAHNISRGAYSANGYFDGYLAETYFIDGQALGPDSFGQLDASTNRWIPKDASGLTFGTNGFYLDMETAPGTGSGAGTDSSGNGNNFTESGLAATDQVTDSPTDNFSVLNPNDNGRPANITLSDGNLTAAFAGSGYSGGIRSSIFFDSEDSDGWYAECTLDSLAFASIFRAGVANASLNLSSTDAQNDANGWAYSDQGAKLNNSYTTGYGSSVTVGDVVGIAVRNGKIYFAVNNTWQGSADPVAESNPAFSNLLGDVAFCQSTNTGGSYAHTATWNFGQTGFTYTPPTGYKSLRVQDLDDPTIALPEKYFNTVLYEGNGGGQRVGQFQPITETYTVPNSVIFNSADSAFLSRTPSSGSAATQYAISVWCKRGLLDEQYIFMQGSSATNLDILQFQGNSTLRFYQYPGSTTSDFITTQVFKDTSTWYHIVVIVDTTLGTAGDRVKIYVNGSRITDFSTQTNPGSSATSLIGGTTQMTIGRKTPGTVHYHDGYMAEFNMVFGTPSISDFGQLDASTNKWIPKAYSGSYGTNGFYLDMETAPGTGSGAGTDSSGNGNNFTESGLTASDQVTDSPTENFCVLNPLIVPATMTFTDGNLALSGYTAVTSAYGTFGMSSGKWYWELVAQTNAMAGVAATPNGSQYPGQAADSYAFDLTNGTKYNNGSSSAFGAGAVSAGDTVGVAFDADNGDLKFYDNSGTLIGTAFSGLTSGTYFPVFRNGSAANISVNFGQKTFSHSLPTGHVELNNDNLPLSNGDLSAFVWIKNRDAADNHMLFDAVRGATKDVHSNTTDLEATNANTLTRFLKNGFEVSNDVQVNTSAESYVAWQWLNDSLTTSSNSDGDITSTVLANTTSGFSIVTATPSLTGTENIGHGLGVAPTMIIGKNLDLADNWYVSHDAISPAQSISLNTTSPPTTTRYNAATTSSVFQIVNGAWTNGGQRCLWYCFAEVEGFSKIGKYTGNGSTDGTFVWTGFKPSFVLWKQYTNLGTNSWGIRDSARDPYNVVESILRPDTSGTETAGSSTYADFLSNGFKLRATDGFLNKAASNYLYMAFAESPFKTATAR